MDGNHTLHIIPYSRQVKADELQPGVCYLQINAADPLMGDQDLGSRMERIFSLSTRSVLCNDTFAVIMQSGLHYLVSVFQL
ncbi:hypothetical protein FNV43_RR20166 [Rhamnella rubrinervis]|uniref:Uncharacterized protein n=1 Tax=Rhamnella rubrinervis TaxID=2594499 RepID=A0A8K0GUC3_9ROSA|nr:hypothetical protein FNV43_RR20166 [Rhamnella rubrinervis]